ncbi:MAG: serine--tRNA ligase [Phycisphaerae bacterium]|nr:serine--tRNA ligase [Phycisphaerae bacterium]
MLDIRVIRDNPDLIRQTASRKKCACDVDRLLEVDRRRREIQQQFDKLRQEQKELGSQIALYRNPKSPFHKKAIADGKTPEGLAAEAKVIQDRLNEIKAAVKPLEEEDRRVQPEFDALMMTVPQPPAPEVPDGEDDTQNVEIRRWGEPRSFDFECKDHVQLGEALGIIDVERGVKLAGARNYLLKGAGALMHQAVLKLAVDMMVERGFVPVTVPVLVRDAMMYGTGYYPGGEEQAYRCERDEKSLVGTSEVALTAIHCDEILADDELPKKYTALSTCFRREAGAAGKDTYGLYRIHFFDKVEQVIVCRNDEQVSIEHHHEILGNAEAVVQALGLPYRVVNVCTGDLGIGQVQKFDIETWMPSRKSYGETHSASRFYEFQARRLNLRYRDANKKVQYCHTLNNTVIASPRIMIPILELYQNADGTVTVPEALRPYMGGMEVIRPPSS